MGGVAKHMNHLYDNPALTFGELEKIFIAASAGSLIGTEKTDGQNLFLSYSVKDETPRAARNIHKEGEGLKFGGMTPRGLATKFKGRGELTKSFTGAFAAFAKAVDLLDIETQTKIFGPDANIWYNAEVQNPSTSNVIDYDNKTVTIHRVGHFEFDKSSEEKMEKDVGVMFKVLEDALEAVSNFLEDEDYNVQTNALRRLEGIADDRFLNEAISRLFNIMREDGMTSGNTISDYMNKRVGDIIDEDVPNLDPKAKEELMKRIFGIRGSSINNVYKILPPVGKTSVDDEELRSRLEDVMGARGEILRQAIWPLEDVVHDFSVEMLRGMESAFVLNNKAEVKKIKQKVGAAIKHINAGKDKDEMATLMRQMEKLKDVENINTASEGFVFDMNGVTYKFTGNFAPINQILGIKKYPDTRGGTSESVDGINEEEGDVEDNPHGHKADVALIPGSFKPPHIGHFNLAKSYLKDANKVIFLVSDPADPKNIRFVNLPNFGVQLEITPEVSKRIFDLYVNDAGLQNQIEILPIWEEGYANPMGFTHDYLADLAQSGEKKSIVLGVSTKDKKDIKRFEDMKSVYEKGAKYPGSNLEITNAPRKPLGTISAEDFRDAVTKAFQDDDYTELKEFIPPKVNPETILNIILDGSRSWPMEKALREVVVGINAPNRGKFKAYKGKELRAQEMFDFMLHAPQEEVDDFMERSPNMSPQEIVDFLDDWAKKQVEESSSMAGMNVSGPGGVRLGDNNDDSLIREEELEEMYTIDRKKFVEELILREAIRKTIKKAKKLECVKESRVRKAVRLLVSEEIKNAPYANTGINELEQLLKKIIPVIEPDYKSLTTDSEQRLSYRSHIITAVKNSLSPGISDPNQGIGILDTPDEDDLGLKEEVDEEVEITVHDDKFIDIDADEKEVDPEQEKESEFSVEGEDETGRNFAMMTWERIETNIVDSYRKLADPKDSDLFYDYLIANLKLYFDKFEDELANVLEEPSSDIYDQEKDNIEGDLGL